MKLIDDIDTSDLTIDLDKLDGMEINDLFRKALDFFHSPSRKNANFMFKKVAEKILTISISQRMLGETMLIFI